MPELRQDIVTGRWVVIATDRAQRPEVFSTRRIDTIDEGKDCPFCPGNEGMTPPEVASIRPDGSAPDSPGWSVRVVPNKYPAFSMAEESLIHESLYCYRPSIGFHEVIIHSPDHGRNLGSLPLSQVESVIGMYRQRHLAVIEDPRIRTVVTIVNHGREAGASLEHSHSQLFAMPLVANEMKAEVDGVTRHLEHSDDCIFCDLIAHEIERAERIIAENSRFIAFCPYASRSPFELWIIPKDHLAAFELASDDILRGFADILSQVLKKLFVKLKDPPYNYWLHTRPAGAVDFHWHLELMPKLTTPGGLELGTGVMINTVRPEDAAPFLRG